MTELHKTQSRVTSLDSPSAAPPVARVEPHTHVHLGHSRPDNFHWLKNRENPVVTEYLHAENAYTTAMMAHTKEFEERLYQEIIGRIAPSVVSPPYCDGNYWRYFRFDEGKEYPIFCRKRETLEAPEEILLDVNTLAEGLSYCNVSVVSTSPDDAILGYSYDTVGRRVYTVQFKDLTTGKLLPDKLEQVTGNFTWASDNKTIFYSQQDPVTLRSHRIFKHRLGTSQAEDILVYEEKDETFWTYVYRSKSREYIFIGSFQTLTSEIRYLKADEPDGEFSVFTTRQREHEYEIDHISEHFYIRSNRDAKNFKLMRTSISNTNPDRWQEVLQHRDDTLLEDFDLFDDYLVATERRDGLTRIRIRPWNGDGEHYLDFGEPAYKAGLHDNHETNTHKLRYVYTSLTTPDSIYEYDIPARTRKLLKQQEVIGDFDSKNYVTERLYASARDGERIPISLVYRKDQSNGSPKPLLLYGYGAYGINIDPAFGSHRLSLIDRGMTYAIAHVRGGQDLGRRWYDDGSRVKKLNSFNDFIDAAEFLKSKGYTSPEQLYAMGGSAGGLLVGGVINMRPDLFHGVVAAVPFVDVISTMLDTSIPLTTGEYDEWGDPNEQHFYEYILQYSPYDNVKAQAYPHMLVTTGLHDSQVQYWEPAKWVAKLRALKTDNNRLLLKVNMDAGHTGVTGRYSQFRDIATEYTFILDLAGLTK